MCDDAVHILIEDIEIIDTANYSYDVGRTMIRMKAIMMLYNKN